MFRKALMSLALLVAAITLWPGSPGALMVSVANVSADPGQAGVMVPISADNAAGIAGGDLTLTYDAGVLTAKAVKGSTLLIDAGITVVGNIATAGQVKISMAGASGIPSGSGAIVTVTFDVKAGVAAGTSDLGIQGTLRDENAKALAATFTKGILTIKGGGGGTGGTGGAGGQAGIAVSIPDFSADPGQAGVLTSIEVDKAAGIAGGDLTLTYDPNILTAKAIRGSALLIDAGITVAGNIATAGKVKISMAGASGIPSGSGAIVTVTFDVKAGVAAGTSDLGIQGTLRDENAKAMPVAFKKGILTIRGTPSGPLTPKAGNGTGMLDLDMASGDQKVQVKNGVKAGDKIDVQVLFGKETAGATGFQAVLGFDPNRLAVTGGKGDGAFASAIFPGGPQVKADSVTYAGSFLGSTTTAKGSVAILTFQAVADFSGETEVTLKSLTIRSGGVGTTYVPGSSVVLSSGTGGKPTPDFDGSGEVDFSDFFLFAVAFGTKQGDPGFDSKYDLDGSGEVGFGDFFEFAAAFGQKI